MTQKAHKITLIPGDGTGPEITDVVVKCIEATGVKVSWELAEAGETAMQKYGTPLPDSTIESIKKNKVALKGPVTTPIGTGFRSVNVSLRKILDLYACIRPCKYYEGVKSRYRDVDLVIVRENTEDLYAGIEFEEGGEKARKLIDFIAETEGSKIPLDSGISIKPISIRATERIARHAFEYALKNHRRKVTAVTKANIMKYSDGLFMHIAEEVSKKYPEIDYEHRLVDNMCMQLVQKPELYDVLVLPNLYGDILSDLCAGLVGGLGVAAGANIGKKYAVFEATHGSAPKYAGMNKVNPVAMILSGVLMLRHLEEKKAADRLEAAVAAVIKEGKDVTYDMKPKPDDPTAAGTKEMGEAIVRKIKGT
jgi:isocitrate dehydrogenase (NAD+)